MTLDTLTSGEITARLSGSPAERTALIREGAQAGVAEAQAVYGQMLLDGIDVPTDLRAAFGWFRKAAAQGHLDALNMVGRCYDLGWGVAVDKVRAAECFRVVATRGLDWGMVNYATALTLGEGVAEDKAAALDWFRRAAATGNAKAANYIGSFHEDGWVVDRDLAEAARWYEIAAQGGDFRGAFNHARMLGEAGDTDAALDWLRACGRTANAAFMAKAEHWLTNSPVAAFHDAGVMALREGAAR